MNKKSEWTFTWGLHSILSAPSPMLSWAKLPVQVLNGFEYFKTVP